MEKWALITGSAVRLGKAITQKLAAENYNLILHYHTSDSEIQELKKSLKAFQIKVDYFQADLFFEEEQDALMNFASELTPHIHILINNASIFPEDSILNFSYQDFEKNFKINSFAPLRLSRLLAKQNQKSSIINLLDTRIVDFDVKHASYHLSKRLLFDITRITAQELAPKIRVNAVAPGLILPPPEEDISYLEKLHHTNFLQSHGTVEDIANAVYFLGTNQFITGQILYVDGGRHMKGNFYGH